MTDVQRNSNDYYIVFIPVTNDGMHIQLWGRDDFDQQGGNPFLIKPRTGRVVGIPYGKCMIIRGNTIHGGGFKEIRHITYKRLQIHISRDSRRSPLPTVENNVYDWYYNQFHSFSDYFYQAPPSAERHVLPLEREDDDNDEEGNHMV